MVLPTMARSKATRSARTTLGSSATAQRAMRRPTQCASSARRAASTSGSSGIAALSQTHTGSPVRDGEPTGWIEKASPANTQFQVRSPGSRTRSRVPTTSVCTCAPESHAGTPAVLPSPSPPRRSLCPATPAGLRSARRYMELSSGFPRRSSQQLGPASGGEDRISALDDDMLLLVLARLGCFRAAARTGGLSRRWRGLWASLRHIVFCDVPFPSLEAALGRVTRPPPGLSLLEIRVTDMQPRRDAAGVTSLLCAAALLEPKELVLALPSGYMGNLSPLFFLQLPDHVRFHELETLSLLGCHVRFDSLLPCCPRLRVLRLKFNDHWHHRDIKTFMSLHSASLQELCVDVENVCIDTVDLVAPELKKLTVSLKAFREVNISILAPMVEKLSWKCSYSFINFGPWRIAKLWLQKAERQGELPSLLIHARISSSIVHGEAENSTQEIEKHMLAKFSVLELHLRPKGHAFGAFMFHLLGMNRFFRATQRLKVVLQRSSLKQECPLDCACDHPDWRSQTSSLTALEEVEINGFQGHDHEIDFLKLIFKCAPMLRRMIVRFSHEVLYPDHHGCTQIRNIFREYSSVECYLYLSSASAAGLEHGSDGFPST